MWAVNAYYGRDSFKTFLDLAESITATVTPGAVTVSGDRATADVAFQISYTTGRKQQPNNYFTHAWTLQYRDNQWILTNVVPR